MCCHLREWARSHNWIEYIREGLDGWQAVIAGKPAPTVWTGCIGKGLGGCRAAIAGKPAPAVWTGYIREGLDGWQAAIAGKPAPTVWTGYIRKGLGGCRAAFAGKPAPTVWIGCIRGRLVGCQAAFAGKPAPTVGLSASGRDWSAVRPPSQASQLPQLDWVHQGEIGRLAGRLREQARSHSWIGYIRRRLVGCQAAFAGKPAPTGLSRLHSGGIGWLVGRHREQARSHRKAKAEAEAEADPHTTPALHHSTGRALARLQLLIYPPLREAEWRCLSGGGRVAPCGEAAHIERRSSRSRP